MFEDALRYPTRGDRALERLVVGGIAVLLSVFVLPIFFVAGYLLRCLAAVAEGEEEPPSYEDWETLFVDGLKVAIVWIAYSLVPFVLGLLVFVPLGASTAVGNGGARGLLAGISVLGFLVLAVVGLVVVFVLMAALTNMAVEGQLAAAFDLGAILRFATSGPYLLAIVLAIVVQILVGVLIFASILFTLGLALLLLFPLGAFLQMWIYLVTVYLFGRAYRDAEGRTNGAGASTGVGP